MRKYKYILFDLDGTLTHSHPGIYACFRYALEKMGRPVPTETQLRKCVGPSLMHSFMHYFGMCEEDARTATAKYRERYSVIGWQENQPIEGALGCLKALRDNGYVLALATSKPKIYSDQITEKFGFANYLQVQVGSGMDGSFPTKASVIHEVIRQLGGSREEYLMVGDRNYDADGAREEGVDCALLRVGYGEEEEFTACAPTYLFNDFSDLTAFLLTE